MAITTIPIKRVKLSVHYQDSKELGKFIYQMVIYSEAVNTKPDMALNALMYIM